MQRAEGLDVGVGVGGGVDAVETQDRQHLGRAGPVVRVDPVQPGRGPVGAGADRRVRPRDV